MTTLSLVIPQNHGVVPFVPIQGIPKKSEGYMLHKNGRFEVKMIILQVSLSD
jgi:hypothetical protein